MIGTVWFSVVDPDPHHFGNLDPHLNQIKIWIRIRIKFKFIKVISWIRTRTQIRINLKMTSQKCMNMSSRV
jgi:hypothetical protein